MRSGKPSTCSSLPTVLTVLTGTRASCNSCFRRFVHLILTSHLSLSLHARTSCLSHTHSSSLYESFIRGTIVWAFLGPDVCLTFSRQGATITRGFRVTLSGFGLGLPQFLCNSMSCRHKSVTELLFFFKAIFKFLFFHSLQNTIKTVFSPQCGIYFCCLSCLYFLFFIAVHFILYFSVCVCVSFIILFKGALRC